MPFLMLYVTYPDLDTANRINDLLISDKLIACANVSKINSSYWWKGEVVKENECVSIMKTRLDLKEKLLQRIEAIHPYDTPCITSWEVNANKKYEAWIDNVTSNKDT